MNHLIQRANAERRSVTCPYCRRFLGIVVGETYPEPDDEDVCCWKFIEELIDQRNELHTGRWTGGGAFGGDRHSTHPHGSSEDGGDNPWGDYATKELEDAR